jgi:hypothetical protein
MTTFNLTCAAVEATLPDYLDETLEPWVRKSIEEHLVGCVRCSALSRELRNITREAAALPALLPEDDVWPRIAHRIGAPVVATEPVVDSAALTPPPAEAIASGSDGSLPISEPEEVASEVAILLSEPPPAPTEEPPVLSDAAMVASEPDAPLSEAEMPLSEAEMPLSEPELGLSGAEMPTSEPNPPLTEPEMPLSEPALLADEPLRLASQPLPPLLTPPARAIAPVEAQPERPQKRWGREWLGLAAAALVLATAGTTYLLTVRWIGRPAGTANVASVAGTRKPSSSEKVSAEPRTRGRTPEREQVVRDSSSLPARRDGQPPSVLAVEATSAAPSAASPEEVVYEREINVLQKIVQRRNAGFDTSTAAVIEKNLGTLDSAIAQIRTALKKDPESSLLDGQASRALQMKVELLRRAAMMRSSSI